jgi:hypothetical protein
LSWNQFQRASPRHTQLNDSFIIWTNARIAPVSSSSQFVRVASALTDISRPDADNDRIEANWRDLILATGQIPSIR